MKDLQEKQQSSRFGLLALIVAALALVGSVSHFWLGPIEPPPTIEESVADQAVKIRDKVVARLTGDKSEIERVDTPWNADRTAMASVALASLLGIILAVVGFVRHEPIRVVGSAAVLAGTALALQYVIIAVGAIVCAIILAAVLNGLDFSP